MLPLTNMYSWRSAPLSTGVTLTLMFSFIVSSTFMCSVTFYRLLSDATCLMPLACSYLREEYARFNGAVYEGRVRYRIGGTAEGRIEN